jgi:DUF4097 and DUF4098 domain-containing protein YvlB
MKLHAVLAVAALATVPLQVACDFESFADNSDRFKEDFQYSFDLKPGGRLSVETFNGSVEILSWEKDSVQITGTKYAHHEEDLKDLKIETKNTPDSVEVRVVRPTGRFNMGAKFFIRVPQRVDLERIASSNGAIRVEEIQGNARLETSNGGIRLRKVNGRLEAKTSNSSIEANDLETDAVLRTSNGSIQLDHVKGAVEANTSNSRIQAVMFSPKPQAPLRFETSNGSIDLNFDTLQGNPVRATTSNSSITLRVPPNIKAALRASTSNSSISSDIDVVTHGDISKSHLEGDINGGGPLVQLSTSNGSIRIVKQ